MIIDVEGITVSSTPWHATDSSPFLDPNLVKENRQLKRELEKFRKREVKSTSLEQENARLKREVEQCRKREDALLAVFQTNYEKEQELSKKRIEIERKEAELQAKEERLEFARNCQEAREQDCVEHMVRLNELEEVSSANDAPDAAYDFDKKGEARRWLYDVYEDFSINPAAHGTYVHVEGQMLRTLRANDYYKGWLDCAKAVRKHEAWQKGIESYESAAHLFDFRDSKSPCSAGGNVGSLFTWSSLCDLYDKPEWDMRIDNRTWKHADFTPPSDSSSLGPPGFWAAVRNASDCVSSKFFDRLRESGIDYGG
jgi:hypothetical protein